MKEPLPMKTLCDLNKKEIEKRLPEVAELVSGAKYMCRKCARSASKKNLLCSPVKISQALKSSKNSD